MIQDIKPQTMHNQFRDEGPGDVREEDTVFSFREREILCHIEEKEENLVSFPCAADYLAAGAQRENFIYLFAIDEKPYWLYLGAELAWPEEAGFTMKSIRTLRRAQPKVSCFAGETGYHLYVWYRDNVFCGRCGQKTLYSHRERAKVCPACGNVIYPKIAPAVIVGITNPECSKIVLTRYAGRAHKGNALVAGFCEIGETAEDTVRREVLEEVGLHVRHIRYFKSQPWGFDSNLLFGYYCIADETEPIHMDDGELARAVWVPREDIGEENRELSLTAEMIMTFKETLPCDTQRMGGSRCSTTCR